MIIQGISAFIATAAFSVIFYLPKKYIIHAGMAGCFGWFLYLIMMEFHGDKVLAIFVATLIVALTAHILARIYKTPVTMFLIPGVIPLVPGAGMYQIVQSIIDNEVDRTSFYFFQTLQMAGAIALGIFVIDTFFSKPKRHL
ncbi:MAG: threonine/serine exporter family protein [Mobilitalea sp.]